MLSKSKSNQINLIKYAVLIPLVFVMLVYTSSYAQEKALTSSSEIENQDTQELTDEALFDKYFNEIVELDGDDDKPLETDEGNDDEDEEEEEHEKKKDFEERSETVQAGKSQPKKNVQLAKINPLCVKNFSQLVERK